MSEAVFITGASSEIGIELARRLPAETKLLAQYHTGRSSLDTLAAERPDLTVVPLCADLSKRREVDDLAGTIANRSETVTGIVHLAARGIELTRFKDLDWSRVDDALEVQVHSIARLLQQLLPRMAKQGGGRVVLVLSSVTISPPPAFMFDYVVAKHALWGVLRALAAEYAGKNIGLNAVSPSMTATKFVSGLPEKVVEVAAERHPRKRLATPAEVAEVIKFLLSPNAAFVSGVNLPVTGGEAY